MLEPRPGIPWSEGTQGRLEGVVLEAPKMSLSSNERGGRARVGGVGGGVGGDGPWPLRTGTASPPASPHPVPSAGFSLAA